MASSTLDTESRRLAQMLIDGIVKTVQNANQLFEEAVVLAKADRVPRALLLHQISLEECGKADLLFTAVFEVLRGQTVDLQRLFRVFLKHQVKNNANAYFLSPSQSEEVAFEQGDTSGALAAFRQMQQDFHAESNGLKNASLYVDFVDGKFLAPSSAVSKEQLAVSMKRNGEFMLMALDRTHLTLKWLSDLDAAADDVRKLWTDFGADKLDRGNPQSIANFLEKVQSLVASAKTATPSN